jgi:hypothetical protein
MCECYECKIRGRSEEEATKTVYGCTTAVVKPVQDEKQMVFPGLTTEEMSAKL